jgi:hypothetical protein
VPLQLNCVQTETLIVNINRPAMLLWVSFYQHMHVSMSIASAFLYSTTLHILGHTSIYVEYACDLLQNSQLGNKGSLIEYMCNLSNDQTPKKHTSAGFEVLQIPSGAPDPALL